MAIDVEFSIWLASKTQWAHLTKVIAMPVVPRVGEYLKFQNKIVGDYFPWKVTEVTYRESGSIEVWTELLNNTDNQWFSFEEEEEFEEYFASYLKEGWCCERGIGPNNRYRAATGPDENAPHKERPESTNPR